MSKELELLENRLRKETLKELEFNSVLEEISKLCHSESAAEKTLEITTFDNYAWLQKEHELVEEVISILRDNEALPLSGVSDISDLLSKAAIKNSLLEEKSLLKVKKNLRIYRLVSDFIEKNKIDLPNLFEYKEGIYYNRFIEKHIDDAIDESGEVKDSASKELAVIRRNILSTSSRLRSRLEQILRKTFDEDYLQEEFFTLREGRFVIPVKTEFKNQIPGIIHSLSNTGNTVFLEPSEIVDMNNSLSLLKNEEKKEVNKILMTLTEEVGSEVEKLHRSNELSINLDVISAKAKYAKKYDGYKPEIEEDSKIELRNIYHPLLLKNKGREEVVPLTIEFDDEKQGHLISGPNAGGKTVALKSIGLNLLMAMSGIFPLGYCKTGLRKIYTSIGDRQSIEMDLSTFSSQIKRTKDILDAATQDSLVLIDEICSGTDPKEGSALASGIIDTVLKYKLKFVVTTHQSSLKTYALNKEGVENASLEFDEENLKPTYNFLAGVPGNSYAFNLAESIGLSKKILERADKYLDTKESEIEKSISEITKFRREAEKIKLEAQKYSREAQSYKQKYEDLIKDIKDKKKEYTEKAKIEAYEVLENANKLVENTIKEIKEEKKSIADIKKEYTDRKTQLENRISKSDKEKIGEEVKEDTFKKGDSVTIEDFDTVGKIIEINDDNKNAIVEFSGLKFKTELDKLNKAKEDKNKKPDYKREEKGTSEYYKYGADSRIDIRGKRVNEAMRDVEQFVNDAIISGLPFLTIVHGKGTGALREAIHEYLNNHQSVKEFRDGTLAEGGTGVTIIEL